LGGFFLDNFGGHESLQCRQRRRGLDFLRCSNSFGGLKIIKRMPMVDACDICGCRDWAIDS
jgi:hypothetical protein